MLIHSRDVGADGNALNFKPAARIPEKGFGFRIFHIDDNGNETTTTLNIRFGIEPADLSVKVEFAGRRLRRGERIAIQVPFRGQEPLHPEAWTTLPNHAAKMVGDAGAVKTLGLLTDSKMEMVLVPAF